MTNWPLVVLFVLAGLGAVGVCLIAAAFVLVAKQGGWNRAMQQPIAEGRWPPARRLMLAGASSALFCALGMVILRLIPGGIPWREPPVQGLVQVPPDSDRPAAGSPVDVPPVPVKRRPRSSDANSLNEQPAPDFDPMLILAWPGAPEETRRRIGAGTDRETTIYRATLTQDLPLTSFAASVYEMTAKDLQGADPQEWLPRHLGGGNTVELFRKQIEFGPHKHLGFEVMLKDANLFVRRVNILAGRRIYTVEVLSIRKERLNADDVAKFFESFAIKDIDSDAF